MSLKNTSSLNTLNGLTWFASPLHVLHGRPYGQHGIVDRKFQSFLRDLHGGGLAVKMRAARASIVGFLVVIRFLFAVQGIVYVFASVCAPALP
jgi:hypothetical protein